MFFCNAHQFLVKREEDLKLAVQFHPEFTHQLFGDDELIKGYADLKVPLPCIKFVLCVVLLERVASSLTTLG